MPACFEAFAAGRELGPDAVRNRVGLGIPRLHQSNHRAHAGAPAEGARAQRRVLICDHCPRRTAEASPSDLRLTGPTKDLLDEIEVRQLNPIVVSHTETASMVAHGLI